MNLHYCESTVKDPEDINTLEYRVNQFYLRHPLIQIRFNVHVYNHRPSCFKKDPECRTELPKNTMPLLRYNLIMTGVSLGIS